MKIELLYVYHRCENIIDWFKTLGGVGASISTTTAYEGKYALRIADPGGASGVAYQYKPAAGKWDLSAFDYLYIWMKRTVSATGKIRLYTDAGNHAYWNITFEAAWTKHSLDLSAPDEETGTLDLSSITYLEVVASLAVQAGVDFDLIGFSKDITSNILYCKVVEQLYTSSYAEIKVKGSSLGLFQAGLELEISDADDVLSWSGRILYPEAIQEATGNIIGSLKVLGIDSQFERVFRKNFTTLRDSDYIIKYIIDNGLSKTLHYDDEIDNFIPTYKYDMKVRIWKMLRYLAMLERAVIHYKPDGEIFFNKYNNLSKHPQLYKATYDFGKDTVGTEPSGWTSDNDANCTTLIKASLDGHKNVLELYDNNAGGECDIYKDYGDPIADSVWEFYIAKSSVAADTTLLLYIRETNTILIQLAFTVNDLRYYDGAWHDLEMDFMSANTFYHIKIICDDTANTFDCYINEVLEGADLPYENNSITGGDRFWLRSDTADVDYSAYIDAVGSPTYDSNYTVGQNWSAWNQYSDKIKITSYTPTANRHITRTPVIGAWNDLGQVYYVGKASNEDDQQYGINQLQPWKDPEISNYTEAKQLGDNLLAIYSMDTQIIKMLMIGKKHIQVGYTVNAEWSGVFTITKANFLVTKRVWYPMNDMCELRLTDNILTEKAFMVKTIHRFYDEDSQEAFEEPEVSESTVAGTILRQRSLAELRARAPIIHIVAGAPDVNYDVADGVEIGDLYIDTTNTKAYICLSNTAGAADWDIIT